MRKGEISVQNDIYTAELMEKNSIRKLIFRLGIPAMFGQFLICFTVLLTGFL